MIHGDEIGVTVRGFAFRWEDIDRMKYVYAGPSPFTRHIWIRDGEIDIPQGSLVIQIGTDQHIFMGVPENEWDILRVIYLTVKEQDGVRTSGDAAGAGTAVQEMHMAADAADDSVRAVQKE